MKNKKYLSFSEIRKTHYIKQFKGEKKRSNIDLNDWKSAPYSLNLFFILKDPQYYFFFLQFTNISPNFVSLVYAALGLKEVYLFLLIYQV